MTVGANSCSGKSYDGVYHTERSKRRMKDCRRCGVAFKDGDGIHVSANRGYGKRHIYHLKCWRAMFI